MSVQFPTNCGGVEGKAIFIDTEGSFSVSRLKGKHFSLTSLNNYNEISSTEMAIWTEKHISNILKSTQNKNITSIKSLTVDTMLKQIYYFRFDLLLQLIKQDDVNLYHLQMSKLH